jgi:hypothetical protein
MLLPGHFNAQATRLLASFFFPAQEEQYWTLKVELKLMDTCLLLTCFLLTCAALPAEEDRVSDFELKLMDIESVTCLLHTCFPLPDKNQFLQRRTGYLTLRSS